MWPCRLGDDDLVAGVDVTQDGCGDCLVRTTGYDEVPIGINTDAVFSPQFVGNRLPQLRDAAARGISDEAFDERSTSARAAARLI